MKGNQIFLLFGVIVVSSSVFGQTIDGCVKNCQQCWKNPSPPAGHIQKSCNVCINSSPKVTSVSGYFDCSGTAIQNCQVHSIDRTTLRVSCITCNVGFMKQTTATGDSCIALTAEYPLCRVGDSNVLACLLCNVNHAVE